MGEVQDGMNNCEGKGQVEFSDQQNGDQVEQNEVAEGIIRFLQKCSNSVQPEQISYCQSIPDDELDVSGLEVPEREE